MSGKGKRGATAPLANSSDEEETQSDVDLDAREDPRQAVQETGPKGPAPASQGASEEPPANHGPLKGLEQLDLPTVSTAADLLAYEGGRRQGLSPVGSPASSSPASSRDLSEHDYALADHDYDNVSSPGSSTASGPTYVRQPGFTYHAHEVCRPKVKKKKTLLNPGAVNPTPPKAKIKRGKLLRLFLTFLAIFL